MDYNELVNAIEGYAKGETFTTQIQTIFIPFAVSRLGRVLKVDENWMTTDLTFTENPHTLDLERPLGSIDAVRYLGARGFNTLSSGDRAQMDLLSRAGGDPIRYLRRGQTLELQPYKDGTVRLDYYEEPAIADSPGYSSPVLGRFPQVYLYGALVEMYIYRKSWGEAKSALDVFMSEVRECNKSRSKAQSDKLQMTRA